jgi:RNA polymerase sigma factor (sigma-70 family)
LEWDNRAMSEAATAPFSRLLSDERLTRRAVGGDERAFAAIFRRYHQSLYRFCLAIVGNPDDASEVLQNTMIKVLRALPGEERKIDLKPWLYRIAHNEAIDLLRRRRETRQLDVEQVAPGYGLAEDVATRERLRRLLVDLKELPERQREVLVMRELAGLEFEEIGSALDTSAAVARQTLYEARQSLHQMEEGREMSCADVTKALSDGDGRVTRRRDVRAHLRSCASCQAFREEIQARQRDLAALAPLPAVAAAGMLHGLISGGSQAATTGGGLATTLGGGAAKTIGASAAAKGVATAAVVAAIGVTAADRSGVIHLGVPGERTTKSAAPTPGTPNPASPAAGNAEGVEDQSGGGVGNSAAGDAAKDAGHSAAAGGSASANPKADSVAGAGVQPGSTAAHAHGHQAPHEEVSAEAQGPQVEHASGQGHEKQHPEEASGGQETAASHKPPQEGGAEKSAAPAATPAKSAHPVHPAHPPKPAHPETSAPPEEAPANPPAAAPETPAPGPPPKAEGAPGAQGASHSEEAPGKAR